MNSDESILIESSNLEPYEAITPIYDKLMSHVEYHRWADFIACLIKRETDNPKHILELACGTGTLANHLIRLGFRVSGFDRSEAMVTEAKRKYKSNNLRFETGDFLDFPLERQYDAAICLYDSVNYLIKLEDLIRFLERIREALKPGGVFIFDICTRYNSRTNFRQYSDEGSINGFHYSRFSDYNLRTHTHINDFQLYRNEDPSVHYKERHVQRIYSTGQIRNSVKKAGLITEAEYDDISFRRAGYRSLRVHFLTRKPR